MRLIETTDKYGSVLFVNPEFVQAYNAKSGQLYLNGAAVIIANEWRRGFGVALAAEAKELVKVNDF